MTEYEKFQQMMSDLDYWKKNGTPNPLSSIKDKDGNAIFEDFFNGFKK